MQIAMMGELCVNVLHHKNTLKKLKTKILQNKTSMTVYSQKMQNFGRYYYMWHNFPLFLIKFIWGQAVWKTSYTIVITYITGECISVVFCIDIIK